MKNIFKYKWVICWLVLSVIFITYSFCLWKITTSTAFMQIGYVFITLGAMALIMFQTFSEANKGAQRQIEVYKDESLKQIKAISDSTKEQITELQKVNNEQIKAMQRIADAQADLTNETTEKHIKNINELTVKQIRANQEESKKQIDSFVEQTNNIVDRLEVLSSSMQNLTDLNKEILENEKELREIELKKARKREEELKANYIDKQTAIERIKPDLHFRTEINTYALVFNFIYVYFYNTGGAASSLIINITLKSSSTNQSTRPLSKTFYNIGRMQQASFKFLRAKDYKHFDQVIIESSVRDMEQREYYGHWVFERSDNVWLKIETDERNTLGKGNSNYLS